jgi:hypothetical protein
MSPDVLKAKVPQRWQVFVKCCGSEARAVEACTWGKGPLVQINSKMVGRANGKYKGGVYPEIVFIHGKVANAYESGDGWVIWESTVLHEMIHWARQKKISRMRRTWKLARNSKWRRTENTSSLRRRGDLSPNTTERRKAAQNGPVFITNRGQPARVRLIPETARCGLPVLSTCWRCQGLKTLSSNRGVRGPAEPL